MRPAVLLVEQGDGLADVGILLEGLGHRTAAVGGDDVVDGPDTLVGVAKAIRLGFDNKAEEPRLVPCTERVVGILKARKEERQTGDRLVWGKMNASRAGYFWNLGRDKLGLTEDVDFVIHACRHTFASRLAMQGVPLNVIKELGGWKTLEMVLRYAHLSPQQKEEAIRKMQQWGRDAAAG